MTTFDKVVQYLANNPSEFLGAVQYHLVYLVLIPVALAVLVSVPVGIMATYYKPLEKVAMAIVNTVQTIPSLALLVFMIFIGLGIGLKPAIAALFLYSLMPILRSTIVGIKGVDPYLKEAATGMGMTRWQRLVMVELPLSLSVIMTGIRTATVLCIGTGTLAAYVGAGGLGTYIVRGLNMMWYHLLFIGAVPSALLALLADWALGKLEYKLIPRGLRNDGVKEAN